MAETIREQARELILQFELAELSGDIEKGYACAYAISHGRDIAQAYMDTQARLDEAMQTLRNIRDDAKHPFDEYRVLSDRIQKRARDFLAAIEQKGSE